MTTAARPARAGTGPRRPALDHASAMRLAAAEYDRFIGQLRELEPADWARPTACPAWDIHAMACHVLGMAELAASPVEQVRQLRAGGLSLDALTVLQVDKHRHRPLAEIIARLAAVVPRAAKTRGRVPWLICQVRLSDRPAGCAGTQTEDWAVGYLTDVILTRDTWMHRTDIAATTGRQPMLTAGPRRHPGRRCRGGVGPAARTAMHPDAHRTRRRPPGMGHTGPPPTNWTPWNPAKSCPAAAAATTCSQPGCRSDRQVLLFLCSEGGVS